MSARAGHPAGPGAAEGPGAGSAAARAAAGRGRPRADCVADAAGGLAFEVRLPAGAPAAVDAPALLLRRRGGTGPSDAVRLPLRPAAAPSGASASASPGPGPGPGRGEAVLRARLPGSAHLPEGRWDAFLATGCGAAGEEPRRLLPGLHDLRALLARTVGPDDAAGCAVRIPYTTKHGNLSVRSWHRRPHAEAGPLHVADGVLVLHGRLYGAPLAESARLQARARGGGAPPVTVPAVPLGEDGDGGGTGGAAREFRATLRLGALPAGPGTWDLWLRPHASPGAPSVRVARILDDVADKKGVFVYPAQRVHDGAGGARELRPYYTLDNDLSLRASRAGGAPRTGGGVEAV